MSTSQLELTRDDGMRLRVSALADGILRIQAGGYDGYQQSLLERYGFVNELPVDEKATVSANRIELPGGIALSVSADFSWTLNRGAETLCRSLHGSKVATAPTVFKNQGFQLDLPLHGKEKLIGFGDHQRESFTLNGRKNALWIRYPIQHVPVPFFMSSRGYGIFFNTTRRLHYDVGATQPELARFAVEKDFLDIFIMTGKPYDELISKYALLTGFPGLPPLKSFGLWLIMHTRANGHDVLAVAKTLRDAEIPCDNLSLEPDWMEKRYDYSADKEWSAEKFRGCPHDCSYRAGPNQMIRALKRMGYELGLWICSRWDFTWEEERRRAAAAPAVADHAVMSLAGIEVSHVDANMGHGAEHMDSVTKTDQPWFEHLKKFVTDGVRFFKVDPAVLINEFPDRLYGNGRHDDEMHNIAFLLCSKQMCLDYEAFTGLRSFGIAVAGWAGLQRFPGTWAGDTGGGKQSMIGIMQDAVVAHPYATCDMSTESAQGIHLGFLLPWALINSWASFHYPGYQGDFFDGVFRDYSRLRMSLLYYFYGLAHRAARTAKAIARPLCLAYPEADEAYGLTGQYLLGDGLLATAYQDDITLPPGRWFDWWTNTVVEGKWDTHALSVPHNRGGHLLVREGALIPLIEPLLHVGEKLIDEISWIILPSSHPGEFTLYIDEGDGFGHKEGKYASATLRCEPTADGLRLKWSAIEGKEPERIAALKHRFELLGVQSLTHASINGSTAEWIYDHVRNRTVFGTAATGEEIVVRW